MKQANSSRTIAGGQVSCVAFCVLLFECATRHAFGGKVGGRRQRARSLRVPSLAINQSNQNDLPSVCSTRNRGRGGPGGGAGRGRGTKQARRHGRRAGAAGPGIGASLGSVWGGSLQLEHQGGDVVGAAGRHRLLVELGGNVVAGLGGELGADGHHILIAEAAAAATLLVRQQPV